MRKYFKYKNWKQIFKGIKKRVRCQLYLLYKYKFFNTFLNFFFNYKIEKRYFQDGLEYAKTNSNSELLFSEQNDVICCKPIFHNNANNIGNKLTKVEGFVSYVAKLNNASIIGGSNLVLTYDGKAIYDLMNFRKNSNYRFTDEGMVYSNNNYCLTKLNNSNISFEEGILLSGNYSWNYFHLIFEILVKFEKIELLKLDKGIPIFMDEVCLKVPQFLELINLFNRDNREIIYLKKATRYLIHSLYYISCPNYVVPNFVNVNLITKHDVLFNSITIDFLRRKTLSICESKKYPTRIFLSRGGASNRRKFNEDEVFEVLNKYNFEVIHPENYSIAEQISIFNNAEIIVGGSGAAFTNLIFCNTNCRVICLTNYKLNLSIFSTIAHYLKIEMIYLTDQSKDVEFINDIHDSFNINTDSLEKIIQRC